MSLQSELDVLLKKFNVPPGTVKVGGGGGWGATASAVPAIEGVAVPIKIDTPNGSLRIYISIPVAVMESPQALMSALEALLNAGYKLDTWQKKTWDRGGGGGSGGGSGGGWNKSRSY